MAWLPLPGDFGTGMLQGMETGSNLLNRLMQQRIAHQQQDISQQKQGISQQQEMREQELQPLKLDLLKAKIKASQPGAITNKENRLIYSSMPANEKSGLLAQLAGMGYSYDESHRSLNQGKSLDELAKAKGFTDPTSYPTPIYPTTVGSLTQIQGRQQALTELDNMGKTITEWTAPYAKRWNGWSPQAIKDALSGKNTDQLAKFLAARGAALDQAAIRVRTLGGKVGEGVLNDMVKSSMANIKFPDSLVNSELYTKTQNYLDELIRNSVTKANKVGLQPGLANQEDKYDNQNVSPQGKKVINGNTYIKKDGRWYQL